MLWLNSSASGNVGNRQESETESTSRHQCNLPSRSLCPFLLSPHLSPSLLFHLTSSPVSVSGSAASFIGGRRQLPPTVPRFNSFTLRVTTVVLILSIFSPLLQIISLLNVSTPQKSLEDFQDVWVNSTFLRMVAFARKRSDHVTETKKRKLFYIMWSLLLRTWHNRWSVLSESDCTCNLKLPEISCSQTEWWMRVCSLSEHFSGFFLWIFV